MHERPALSQGVILVLGLAVLFNYVDRANLATAAPLLQDELSLSPPRSVCCCRRSSGCMRPAQLLAGWLVHRFESASCSRRESALGAWQPPSPRCQPGSRRSFFYA